MSTPVVSPARENKATLYALLLTAMQQRASDLHLASGQAPRIRVDGDLTALSSPPLSAEALQQIAETIMTPESYQQWRQGQEMDVVYAVTGLGRFRAHALLTIRGPTLIFRTIAEQVPTLTTLQLPKQLIPLCQQPHGLILVTGPTGCGKSSTVAAMIDYINETQPCHIVTIEDPVEFYHPCKKALVNQRQIGHSTKSFHAALYAALRQDPDVVLIGELRDLDTVRLALTMAETGHLVFATLHTQSASQTLHRLIHLFPGNEKAMVRSLLAASLQAVVSQRLLKRIGGGRVAACELMIVTPAIRHMIVDDRIAQIPSVMQSGAAIGMMTLAQATADLMAKGIILNPMHTTIDNISPASLQ